MKRLFCLSLLILLMISGSVGSAQTLDYDGLRFTLLPDLASKNYSGYVFVRVLIANASGRERNLRIFIKSDYSRDIEEVSRKFSVSSGGVREEALFLPISDFSSAGLRVEVDGVLLRDTLSKYFRSYRNYYTKKQALVDSAIARTDFDAAFAGTGAKTGFELEMNQFEGSLSQLYRNWLGYSQFDALIFYADTIRQMPDTVRSAVYDYVRAGGFLLSIGDVDLPADFYKCNAPDNSATPCYAGGFGRVAILGEELFKQAAAGGEQSFVIANFFSTAIFRNDPALKFVDDEIETVSARWLMAIIYLFAFLIGPVNVFVLHRIRRKIWVFFTVPFASLLCCSFIYTYYVIYESSTFKIKRQSLTLLDERENRAITLANYAVFSSRSRPEGFHYDMNTEVYPITKDDYRSNDAGRYIFLDEDQHFADGWIKPKVPRYMHIRSIQNRRERVQLLKTAAGYDLVNGLGEDIQEIWLLTRDNICWKASFAKAGEKTQMQQVGVGMPVVRSFAAIYDDKWFNCLESLKRHPQDFLSSGTYIARLKASPFLKQAIETAAETTDEAYVIGILKEEPQQ
ncbi:MAG: hypothetical protein EOM80_01605 [Erysipelotrichia bacterium]|nr:hypothetical protein [Erysipelotrichia bacterium]